MSSLDDIPSKEVFDAALANQREAMFDAIDHASDGSDVLSALIKVVISGGLLVRIADKIGASLDKWIVYKTWHPTSDSLHEVHTRLWPLYSASMDAKVPGESIVMLAKQHRPPGVEGERWAGLQEGAKVSYLANTPILACRLNGLKALLR